MNNKKELRRRNRLILLITVLLLLSLVIILSRKSNNNIEHRSQWYLKKLFEDSELYKQNEKKVKIAIIDSGIYTDHPDLKSIPITEYCVNGVDVANNNDYEHGTNVCGIICAYPSSEKGIVGIVNNNCEIISIDISDNSGIVGAEGIVEGFNYAIESDVDIINISFSTENDYPQIREVVSKANERGIIIVASAGNDFNGKANYPAAYDEVLSVASYSKNEKIIYSELEDCIYLPGENVVTTSYEDKDAYVSRTGTSFSAPILTGMIAKVLSDVDDKKEYSEKLMNISGKILSYRELKTKIIK